VSSTATSSCLERKRLVQYLLFAFILLDVDIDETLALHNVIPKSINVGYTVLLNQLREENGRWKGKQHPE